MKRVVAIGGLGDDIWDFVTGDPTMAPNNRSKDTEAPAAPAAAPSPAKTVAPSRDSLTPRTAASLPRWMRTNDTWLFRWRAGDTWFAIATRYLGAGNRWQEIWSVQDAAFRARVPKPESIYVGALVRMPAEALTRAQALKEIPPGPLGPSVPTSPQTPSAPSPISPAKPTPQKPSPAGGGKEPAPIHPPAPPAYVPAAQGDGHVMLWVLCALGVAGLATVGVVAYRAHQREKELEGKKTRPQLGTGR